MEKLYKITPILEKVSLILFVALAFLLSLCGSLFTATRLEDLTVAIQIIEIVLVVDFIVLFSWFIISKGKIFPFINSLITLVCVLALVIVIDHKDLLNSGIPTNFATVGFNIGFYILSALFLFYGMVNVIPLFKKSYDDEGSKPKKSRLERWSLYSLVIGCVVYYGCVLILKHSLNFKTILQGFDGITTVIDNSATSLTLATVGSILLYIAYIALWVILIIGTIQAKHKDYLLLAINLLFGVVILAQYGNGNNILEGTTALTSLATPLMIIIIIILAVSGVTLILDLIQVVRGFMALLKEELKKSAPVIQVQYEEVEEQVVEKPDDSFEVATQEDMSQENQEEEKPQVVITPEEQPIVEPTYQPKQEDTPVYPRSEFKKAEPEPIAPPQDTVTKEASPLDNETASQETPLVEETKKPENDDSASDLASHETPVLLTPIDLKLEEPLNTYHHDAQERLLQIKNVSFKQEDNDLAYFVNDQPLALIEWNKKEGCLNIYTEMDLESIDQENVAVNETTNDKKSLFPTMVTIIKSQDNQNARKYLRRLVEKYNK